VRRLWSPGWILAHLAAIALVVGFLLLGWWQVRRAAGGNLLSFGYAIEWPVFAAFVVYVWIKEMRRAVRQPGRRALAGGPPGGHASDPHPLVPVRGPRVGPAYDDTGDEELAAYNRYLAWLNAHPHASPSEYPG
jgi:hypothetical protein